MALGIVIIGSLSLGVVGASIYNQYNSTNITNDMVFVEDNVNNLKQCIYSEDNLTPCVVASKGFKNYFKEEGLKVEEVNGWLNNNNDKYVIIDKNSERNWIYENTKPNTNEEWEAHKWLYLCNYKECWYFEATNGTNIPNEWVVE